MTDINSGLDQRSTQLEDLKLEKLCRGQPDSFWWCDSERDVAIEKKGRGRCVKLFQTMTQRFVAFLFAKKFAGSEEVE